MRDGGPATGIPGNPEQLEACLLDARWRLDNLYQILVDVKAPMGSTVPLTQRVMDFRLNPAQERFIARMWHRNIVLKARQVGITTLICILWLDHALFTPNQRCGIVAQDDGAAKIIFRDKVKFAYDHLLAVVRKRFPLTKDAADELLFAHNNSSVRVATSMRSGTLDRLHVSEFGKICAMFPIKANEVITGSIPAAQNGIIVIESTAEGREGAFFDMVQVAEKNTLQRVKLTIKDYRLHFTAWWQHGAYTMDPSGVHISDKDNEYFNKVQTDCSCTINLGQRAWYVKTRDTDFGGSAPKMWQEYPSTPEESFQVSGDGHYYAKDMQALRKRGGIRDVPILDVPVNTFWDIGRSDGCACWLHQEMNGEDRFVGYFEAHNESLGYYVRKLREIGADLEIVFNKHYLPHDAAHKRLSDTNQSVEEQLNGLGMDNTVVVPVITTLINGIEQTRKHLKGAYFDRNRTAEGVSRIDGYQKKWNQTDQTWLNEPNKRNGCSEGADAFRQWAQAKEGGMITLGHNATRIALPPPPDWRQ